jgi:glycosyltransferase involved in cell wall biosynthesis
VVEREEERKQGVGFALRVAANLLSPRPYVANKYITGEMAARVKELISKSSIDLVVCDFLEMAWCAEMIDKVPKVLFEHNVESMIWKRHYQFADSLLKKAYLWYEKKRMARFERRACSQFDLVLTVSDSDGDLLAREFGVQRSLTVPTGVDSEYFRPQAGEAAGRLVLSGSMDWLPNIDAFWWFYREIYPQIREAIPEVTLTVVGRRPPGEIVGVGRRDPSVEVTGTVEDVRPHVAAGVLFLVPLRIGGGTRIKIYEAMAMSKCVVSTSVGAEGLPLTADETVVLADSAPEFAKKVIDLLRDDCERNRIAATGRRLVNERFGWRQAAATLHQGLTALMASGARDD